MRSIPGLLLALVAVSCSNAALQPVPKPEIARADNKLSVNGSFCTTNPDDLLFPVKILFIIDTSQSMGVTDPQVTRLKAILDVANATFTTPGVGIAIEIFGTSTSIITEKCDDYTARTNCVPGFAPPPQAIQAAGAVAQNGGTTDFVLALETAVGVLASDMEGTDATTLANSRYAVIMLSDGLPDTDSQFDATALCGDPLDPNNQNGQSAQWAQTGKAQPGDLDVLQKLDLILGEIGDLAEQFQVRELTVNTAFASAATTDSQIKACGGNMMRGIAKRGGGTFRDFSSGEAINFLFVDFTSFKRLFAMKNFTAFNINARPFSEAIGYDPNSIKTQDVTIAKGIIDSDGDGLPDELENLIGTDPQLSDTDNDGFSDLLEYRLQSSGFDPLNGSDADCKGDKDRFDDDGDGLRNCEEIFVGTNNKVYDTDNDGFGDGLETLYGTNPTIDDTLLDVDFDGVTNGNEIREHSNPQTDDIVDLSDQAYRYHIVQREIQGAQICYDFTVDNVSLASTIGSHKLPKAPNGTQPAESLGAGEELPGENRVIFEVAEAPFDDPTVRGVSRLACARARFNADKNLKDPANGTMTLPQEAFKPADQFNPEVDCVDP
jgi:hypothetical protein